MSLFSRMFGTTEKGEAPAPGETEPGGDLARWPYLTVPVQRSSSASPRSTSASPPPPPEPQTLDPSLAPVPATRSDDGATALEPAAASTPVGAVRALQTIIVQTPGPSLPDIVATPTAENDEIELNLEWLASDTPLPGLAHLCAPDPTDRVASSVRFLEMAVEDAPPLRELMLMLGLALGPTPKRCLELVKRKLAGLLEAARQLEQAEASALLTSFDAAVTVAANGRGSKIVDSDRDALLAAYARLAQALPAAFDLTGERERREPLLVHYLLRQVPDVHQLTIDKLRAAGYGSLEALCCSSSAKLVAFGIDTARADAISRRVRCYCRERAECSPEQVKPRMRALIERLTRAHADYERADAAEERARKRSARSERRAASLELSMLLAQAGEIELVEGLERSPTERKIEIVRRYLERPQAASGAALGEWT